jgi:hypothetical protein
MAKLTAGKLLALPLLVLSAIPALGNDKEMMQRQAASAQIRLDHLDPALQKRVADVVRQPTLYYRGPVEAFPCRCEVYRWLLDHPHWGFRAWQTLGAKCAAVEQNPDGSFSGADANGNKLIWQTIQAEPGKRVWYAEGSGKPLLIGPTITVRAVVMMRYQDVEGPTGKIGVRQRADVFAAYDSAAAQLAAKVFGGSTDSAAQKFTEQICLFFSGMAFQLTDQPEWARKWVNASQPKSPTEVQQLNELKQILEKP